MQSENIDICQIFLKISEGEETALWQLHEKFFKRIFRFVLTLTGNKEVTEEVVNDTFLDIWQKRHLLPTVNNPVVYILTCAKNRSLKHLKKQTNYELALKKYSDIPCGINLTPHDILISRETLQAISVATQSLPPQCKLIFSLVKENNLKYREVAELLGLSVKTIENQMGVALKKLTQSVPSSLLSSKKK